ncbi:protein HIRA isoform X3 [Aplysia californica]|uniref:Protein HIRA n=1 Tax=Aplysia californica TaxID=6500 RepID=A0ABM0K848_APLCA|nr:protein HIRA isoform X3 [Aplysia californica]
MKIVKPGWVNHDGKPVFSVDFHPDGSRFVTGGQGEDYGKIVIWNMAPVRDESLENTQGVPKILCQMNNHYACVNCVRWSHNGKFLASGGDDKLVMIWQTSRAAGPSKAFGSTGSVVIHEQWRPVHTLRAHSGDVLDLNWSPQDIWLATCSVDNTIIIWNALKFPEQVATLRGHSGMVKGVTWDPVGKYLATQSDDRTVRVWRTMDWQQESVITEPFKECGGTTHSLRLNWSPDGHHVVSAHAMNNSGPTAQIIERQGFKATLDFVGHRKAVTVVRFNPNMFTKSSKGDKSQPYSCCAVGSKDRSVSIWLTCLKRPLVVMHDLFENSVLDLSWSLSGLELLICSIDGTVGFLEFSAEEIGWALTKEDMTGLLESVYGKSISLNMATSVGSQIIESAAMLNLQEQQKSKEAKVIAMTPTKNSNMSSQMSASGDNTPFKPVDKQIETRTADGRRRITPIFLAPQPEFGEVPLPFTSNSNIGFHSSSEKSKIVVEKQNRVTAPGMLSPSSGSKSMPSPPISALAAAAVAAGAAVRDALSSSSQHAQSLKAGGEAVLEKAQAKVGPEGTPEKTALKVLQAANETTPEKTPMTTTSNKLLLSAASQERSSPQVEKVSSSEKSDKSSVASPVVPEKSKAGEKVKDSVGKDSAKDKVKTKLPSGLSLKRKLGEDKRYGKRGRPSKVDQAAREAAMAAAAAEALGMSTPKSGAASVPGPVSASAPGTATAATNAGVRVMPAIPRLKLTPLSLGKSISKVLSEVSGEAGPVTLEVENSLEVGVARLHRLRLLRGGRPVWEHMLTSEVAEVVGSREVVCAACVNGTVSVFSIGGRRLLPALVIGSSPAVLACSGHHVMAVSDKGQLFVWNFQTLQATVKQESLLAVMSEKDSLEQATVTSEGVPVITLANRKSYCYSVDIGCWILAQEPDDRLQASSAHHQCTPTRLRPLGPLSSIQKSSRPSDQASRSFQSVPAMRQSVTLSHLESQMATSLVLKSGSEWKFWLETYIRYLAQEGVEDKLREVCDDLLGPVYKSRSSKKWSRYILGVDKHAVLRSALPSIGADLKFQRLYTEYKDQLDMV